MSIIARNKQKRGGLIRTQRSVPMQSACRSAPQVGRESRDLYQQANARRASLKGRRHERQAKNRTGTITTQRKTRGRPPVQAVPNCPRKVVSALMDSFTASTLSREPQSRFTATALQYLRSCTKSIPDAMAETMRKAPAAKSRCLHVQRHDMLYGGSKY